MTGIIWICSVCALIFEFNVSYSLDKLVMKFCRHKCRLLFWHFKDDRLSKKVVIICLKFTSVPKLYLATPIKDLNYKARKPKASKVEVLKKNAIIRNRCNRARLFKTNDVVS